MFPGQNNAEEELALLRGELDRLKIQDTGYDQLQQEYKEQSKRVAELETKLLKLSNGQEDLQEPFELINLLLVECRRLQDDRDSLFKRLFRRHHCAGPGGTRSCAKHSSRAPQQRVEINGVQTETTSSYEPNVHRSDGVGMSRRIVKRRLVRQTSSELNQSSNARRAPRNVIGNYLIRIGNCAAGKSLGKCFNLRRAYKW